MPGNSSRQLYPVDFCATKGLVLVVGSFELAGSGEVTNVRGDGFTVVRAGVGEFTITLAEKYPELVSQAYVAEDEDGDGDVFDVVVTPERYDSANGTVTIRTTGADGASAQEDFTGDRVNFVLYLQKFSGLNVSHT